MTNVADYINTTHLYLGVEAILTDEEKQTFLNRVHERNPQLRGAAVADVIDIMCDRDAYLEYTEPLYEAHEAEIVAYGQPRLFSLCCYLAIYIKPQEPSLWSDNLWTATKSYMDRWLANRCGHVWYEAPQEGEQPNDDGRVARSCTLDKDHTYPIDHHDRRAPNF
jgi:hypothetical protein